jgi:hypothetical protein
MDRLGRVIDCYRASSFEWGHHDCVLFAARCVDAQCGSNFEERIRQDFRYGSALSALRLIQEAGGFEAIVSRYLGAAVPASDLKIGDVVLGRGPGIFADCQMLGICDEELFVAPDSQALVWLPMKLALKGWHCPEAQD